MRFIIGLFLATQLGVASARQVPEDNFYALRGEADWLRETLELAVASYPGARRALWLRISDSTLGDGKTLRNRAAAELDR